MNEPPVGAGDRQQDLTAFAGAQNEKRFSSTSGARTLTADARAVAGLDTDQRQAQTNAGPWWRHRRKGKEICLADAAIAHVDNIPQAFKDLDRWLLFDVSDDTPRRPHWCGDFYVSWSDPAAWNTFEEAYEAYSERLGWGLLFVIQPDDPFYVIDIDRGHDGIYGDRKPWVPSYDNLDCYREWSPSATGQHIPVRGEPPEWSENARLGEHEGIDILTNKPCSFTGDVDGTGGRIATTADVENWLAATLSNIRWANGETPADPTKHRTEATADSEDRQRRPQRSRPTPTADELDELDELVHHDERRAQLRAVLRDPTAHRDRRQWLVGFLSDVVGLSEREILSLIHRRNRWSNYDREKTSKQVSWVIKSSRN